jgi:hypothetical protein
MQFGNAWKEFSRDGEFWGVRIKTRCGGVYQQYASARFSEKTGARGIAGTVSERSDYPDKRTADVAELTICTLFVAMWRFDNPDPPTVIHQSAGAEYRGIEILHPGVDRADDVQTAACGPLSHRRC